MPFDFQKTKLVGVVHITPKIFPDERGEFTELYKDSAFTEAGIDAHFVQVNHSKSKKHVIRALHYQLPPKAQGKLVQVSHGSVFDVAVDIRKDSVTYGKWVGVTLTAREKNMLYIPPGFAHGFCTLEDDTELVYFCTDEYSKEHERGIVWNDPAIGIEWPVQDPIISDRDANFPVLADAEH
ncbi:MAG TPA: dTDP-4-dehydrorhamnose 3,5-epimerase [Candidatus Andersenbacteria bacterium]|nr:dTDP-4-dehydrorhamnose 3,5-epimerase [Candidatus Andersenbacteria bacterium]